MKREKGRAGALLTVTNTWVMKMGSLTKAVQKNATVGISAEVIWGFCPVFSKVYPR